MIHVHRHRRTTIVIGGTAIGHPKRKHRCRCGHVKWKRL